MPLSTAFESISELEQFTIEPMMRPKNPIIYTLRSSNNFWQDKDSMVSARSQESAEAI